MISAAGNASIVANAADPFDTPEQIVIRERINCVNSLAHWQIITESESIKEPRGRSRSQSYSQIALLHSPLFLHDQLTFADISGTDSSTAPLTLVATTRVLPDTKRGLGLLTGTQIERYTCYTLMGLWERSGLSASLQLCFNILRHEVSNTFRFQEVRI